MTEKEIIKYYIGKIFLEFAKVDTFVLNFIEPIFSTEKFRNLTMGQKLLKIKKEEIGLEFYNELDNFINNERNPFIHSFYFLGFGNEKEISYTSFNQKSGTKKDLSKKKVKQYFLKVEKQRKLICELLSKYYAKKLATEH